jgi:Protein of unknown function (DUF732)
VRESPQHNFPHPIHSVFFLVQFGFFPRHRLIGFPAAPPPPVTVQAPAPPPATVTVTPSPAPVIYATPTPVPRTPYTNDAANDGAFLTRMRADGYSDTSEPFVLQYAHQTCTFYRAGYTSQEILGKAHDADQEPDTRRHDQRRSRAMQAHPRHLERLGTNRSGLLLQNRVGF